jgi:hypothetical protein
VPLLDDHVVDQVREIVAVVGAQFQRTAVEDDPRRQPLAARPAG